MPDPVTPPPPVQAPPPTAPLQVKPPVQPQTLTWGEKNFQFWITVLMVIASMVLLLIGYYAGNIPTVALSAAALGGFLHEIIQSGGSVAFPKSYADGFYLGSVYGLLLGIVAGMLFLEATPTGLKVDAVFVSQVFFAGLALKGVSEAAGGQVQAKPPT